jgi:2-polyprenyl-3-methyl-5-hydroxy-6-metoxy-1,4-benzoquinol methylase
VDVGAGQGSFLRRLRDLYPDVVTTALEPSTSSCAVMEESGEISNVINGLNLPKTRFDLIVSSHTLEHVEDVVKTMREYFNALNVGGYLFVEVPFASEQHFDAAHEYLPHTFFFTPKSMYVLAEVVGFNMVKTETGGISYLDLVAGRSKLGWQLDVWRKSGVMGANLRVLLQRCR